MRLTMDNDLISRQAAKDVISGVERALNSKLQGSPIRPKFAEGLKRKLDEIPPYAEMQAPTCMPRIIEAIVSDMQIKQEGCILRAVQEVISIDIDKPRLIRALTNAEAFWHEGYEAGRASLRPKGEWIDKVEFNNGERVIATCSNCKDRGELRTDRNEWGLWHINSPHCPTCGADMRKEAHNGC